jgi:nucleotide-binding universal stress UspA family protein
MDATFSVEALTPSEMEAEVREARQYLTRLAETLADSRVVVRHRVIEAADAVAKVILDTARHEQADLIALGTHAKAGVARLVLGSVSEEILESSPIPVLLVHQASGAFADTSSTIASTRHERANGVGLASADRLR